MNLLRTPEWKLGLAQQISCIAIWIDESRLWFVLEQVTHRLLVKSLISLSRKPLVLGTWVAMDNGNESTATLSANR
jgi:hypothetical protein